MNPLVAFTPTEQCRPTNGTWYARVAPGCGVLVTKLCGTAYRRPKGIEGRTNECSGCRRDCLYARTG